MRRLLPAAGLAVAVLGPSWLLHWPPWVMQILGVPELVLFVMAMGLVDRRDHAR